MSMYFYYIITSDEKYYIGTHLSELIMKLKWMKQYGYDVRQIQRVNRNTDEVESFTIEEFRALCAP